MSSFLRTAPRLQSKNKLPARRRGRRFAMSRWIPESRIPYTQFFAQVFRPALWGAGGRWRGRVARGRPVSYTHLTLPTICSV
eukprot:7364038-Alexandrium_andersonii.AAC.1